MKLILSLLFAFTFLGGYTHAAPVKRLFQDIKLPTQKVLEAQSWATPAFNGSTDMLSAVAGPPSAAAFTITSFSAQPDFARNLVMANQSNSGAGDQGACIVTVSGLNANGHAMSETFTFSASTFSILTGSKAFKSVSSVSFPASCATGGFSEKYDLGFGVKYGLKRCLANAGDVFKELLDGANATIGTVATSSSLVESNTISFNTAQGGGATHSYVEYFVQNNQCF